MKNFFLFLLGCFLSGCGSRYLGGHIADLRVADLAVGQILFLPEEDPIRSSDPLDGVIPLHGGVLEHRIRWRKFDGSCPVVQGYQICSENFLLNAGLEIKLTDSAGKVSSVRYHPQISDVLFRFLGAPTAVVYQTIDFADGKIGVLHSFGFSLIRNGHICANVQTNPNHHLSFGESLDHSKILLFSSGTSTSADRPVEGWRVYDEDAFCK